MDRMVAWLFDLDGVLVDSGPAYRGAWARWAEDHGIDEAAIWSDAHGKRPEDIIRRVAPDLSVGDAVTAFDTALAARARWVRSDAGAVECLAALAPRSWAIVTSGRGLHVRACLKQCGLPAPFVLVCGDDISRGKPDPECFLKAAGRLGAEPASCTVIEDAPAGIKAAQAAGMSTIAIATTHDASELAGADETFASLRDAAPRLLTRAGDERREISVAWSRQPRSRGSSPGAY